MFVFSWKTSKRKLFVFALLAILLILCCIWFFLRASSQNTAISSVGQYSLLARNNAARLEFLSQFGWETDKEPVAVCKIVIPSVFNEVYQRYNEIQKEQGLNLARYKGKSCKRFTYNILNYDTSNEETEVNLLIYKGKVIGGDVSSKEVDGFMHGFVKPSVDEKTSKKIEQKQIQKADSNENRNPALQTTSRESLEPDPAMPNAPTD